MAKKQNALPIRQRPLLLSVVTRSGKLISSMRSPKTVPDGPAHGDAGGAGSRCLFCAMDDPRMNRVIAQNKTCYVRLDNYPASLGHIEVVPKRHVVSYFELSAREIKDAYKLMMTAREKIENIRGSRPDGYTIGINEGPAAGRTVDHLHIHMIPRQRGDVTDPRGGIRQVLPNNDPDAWAPRTPQKTQYAHQA